MPEVGPRSNPDFSLTFWALLSFNIRTFRPPIPFALPKPCAASCPCINEVWPAFSPLLDSHVLAYRIQLRFFSVQFRVQDRKSGAHAECHFNHCQFSIVELLVGGEHGLQTMSTLFCLQGYVPRGPMSSTNYNEEWRRVCHC
jgi:hypothetical protein